MEYSVFKPIPIYRRHTNFAIEYTEKNINENHDQPLIPIDTMNTLLGIQHKITKELPIPNKIISPWNVTKPIIIFYEPFEIMIKDTTKYLQETKMTQNMISIMKVFSIAIFVMKKVIQNYCNQKKTYISFC